MRRGKDYRLRLALSNLASLRKDWIPPAGERASCARKPFGRGRVTWTSPDHLAVQEKGAQQVIVEQENATPRLPFEPVFLQSTLSVMDWLLSDLDDDECQRLFEEQAARGADARDEMRPLTSEELELPPAQYSTTWERVSDEVFLQYGRLEDRRPA
jgi:hypothetical protein